MNKQLNTIFLMAIIWGISSCSNDHDPLEDGNHRGQRVKVKNMKKTMKMSFGGDFITETDEPLLRADDKSAYVGINVWRTENNKANAKEEKYAFGVFPRLNGISIDVITGYTYRFEASILIDDEDKLILKDGKYHDPFRLHDESSTGFDNAWGFAPDDPAEFHYADSVSDSDVKKEFLCQLSSGTAYVKVAGALPTASDRDTRSMMFPSVKRFYGGTTFNPTLSTDSVSDAEAITIPMSYKSFGIKLNLVSIPAGTSLRVRDVTYINTHSTDLEPEHYIQFSKGLDLKSTPEESKTWSGIYSLNNFSESSRTVVLRFFWMKGGGRYETFDHTFTVEAGKMKVLNLTIDGEPNSTKSGNIVLDWSDTLITEDTDVKKDFKAKQNEDS